ncbi:isohexenylglutaconyl-CoA hydratase [Enhydrobacter aerosaccus]|uniref:Isohexenylglutaconyl-CoA hydratase n=1 Tax=Enhydrobacter aerosaccus TaxID=225324 RepID=A0A1T4LFU5_9HYPH|nr:enoyl-CoA hydratase/isomerase family protein [Enhydrobacter aerosaccus]SJZ53467.1 isohexenylglutaconyl-CoA hydratase [Enhydrobacter aerosaccus]
MGDYDTITLTRDGAVMRLMLNRPERRNALTQAMMLELEDAFNRVAADNECRLLVLRGAGGHFSAGGDLAAMAEMPPAPDKTNGNGTADPLVANYRQFGRALDALNTVPQPTIAVVEGSAVGGGFGMACCSDVVILHESARFGLPEPKAGFIPSQILPFIVRRIGEGATRDLALTARVIDAAEAYRIGVGRHLCATTADLNRTLKAAIDDVLKLEPQALATVKRLTLASATEDQHAVLDDAAHSLVGLLRRPQASEGIAAFLNKKSPSWAKD